MYGYDKPEFRIEYEIPHLILYYNDKKEPILRIEDTEVFDTIDDILTEDNDIENYSHTTEKIGSLTVYTIYFDDNIDKDILERVVKAIDKDEIERIFRLNNSK